MPLLYDIDKQLIDIAKEFEKKFTKQGQDASLVQRTALKLLDDLKNKVSAVQTSDLKNLRALIEYCLKHEKKTEDGFKIVYNGDKTLSGSSVLSKEFGDSVPDAKKDEFVEYSDEQVSYYVHKSGFINFLAELQTNAGEQNKIAEVMIRKLMDEANAKLQLGIDKNNLKPAHPWHNMGRWSRHSQPGQPGAQQHGSSLTNKQETEVGKLQLDMKIEAVRNSIHNETIGQRAPLGADQLDLYLIRLFVERVKNVLGTDHFDMWIQYRYKGYDQGPIDKIKNDIKNNTNQRCDQVLTIIHALTSKMLIKYIIPPIVIGGPGLVASFLPLMTPYNRTGPAIVQTTTNLIHIVTEIPSLLEVVTDKVSLISGQKDIASTWEENLNSVKRAASTIRAGEPL